MPFTSGLEAQSSGSVTTGFPYEHDERWLLVQRIVGSRLFNKASQLREILIYVTQQVLLDQEIAIPEHEIACKVLGRREGFNPNDDNIVRVQAGHLRKKLDQYFLTEGLEEPCVLVIPKGTYIPHFMPRHNVATAEKAIHKLGEKTEESQPVVSAAALMVSVAEPEPTIPLHSYSHTESETFVSNLSDRAPMRSQISLRPLQNIQWYWLLVAFGLGIGAMACYYRLTSPSVAAARAVPLNIIEQRIFSAGVPVSVVTTDSSLVLLQNTLHTDISIGDYVGGKYPANLLVNSPDDAQRIALEYAAAGRYTSLGDLTIALQCEELAQKLGASTTLRYARYMSVRDFEKGNFILIGSRRGNPWISLFEPQLNFALEEDKETHLFHFANKNPQSGEDRIYLNQQQPHGEYLSYVDIALVPNLTRTGYVLLLNGSVMDSNEAAAHLVFDENLPVPLSHSVNAQATDKPQSIEIFLRVHSLQGAPSKVDVIATRTSLLNS